MFRSLFRRKRPVVAPPLALRPPDPLAPFYAEAERAARRYDEAQARDLIAIEPATLEDWLADGEIALRKKVTDGLFARMTSMEPFDPDVTDVRRRSG